MIGLPGTNGSQSDHIASIQAITDQLALSPAAAAVFGMIFLGLIAFTGALGYSILQGSYSGCGMSIPQSVLPSIEESLDLVGIVINKHDGKDIYALAKAVELQRPKHPALMAMYKLAGDNGYKCGTMKYESLYRQSMAAYGSGLSVTDIKAIDEQLQAQLLLLQQSADKWKEQTAAE